MEAYSVRTPSGKAVKVNPMSVCVDDDANFGIVNVGGPIWTLEWCPSPTSIHTVCSQIHSSVYIRGSVCVCWSAQ
jgi:hypothetical protein